MNKREFIKSGLIGVVGLSAAPALARNSYITFGDIVKQPRLPYSFGSFSGFLSEKALEAHYVVYDTAADNLKQLSGFALSGIQKVRDILLNASSFEHSVVQNASAFLNHKIFFNTLTPKGTSLPDEKLHKAINSAFGSFENFKQKFESTALSIDNAGWVWLVYKNKQLEIITTANDNNPLSELLPDENRGFPLMGLDMWEHAYYLDYQADAGKYIRNFWAHINWNYIDKRFQRDTKLKF
ncbi:MAG: superoxide dismutase [Bacteroidales bacterium]|nr:superoxide dismutase [Bacteroidales bacterium]